MKLFFHKTLLVWFLVACCSWGLTLALLSLTSEPASAQNFIERLWRRFTSRPSRDERPAAIGQGGANRDRCPYTDQELVALVPTSEDTGLPYLEKTVAAYPTWYFYVPYQPQLGRQVEFVLLDADENILYQETLTLTNTPGILSLSLPENVSGLEINHAYRWVFSVVCNPANRSGDATVNGWLERVSSVSLPSNPETVDIRERYLFYAEELLWFDSIDELASLRRNYSEDPEVEEAWSALLEFFGLHGLPHVISPIN